MWRLSRYETVLEQVGTFLTLQEAQQVEVVDEDSYLTVSWQTASGARERRCFREENLAAIRPGALANRRGTQTLATLLKTLGQDIDRAELEVGRIEETTDGFLVSGTNRGRYFSRRFSYPELWAARRDLAAGQPEAATPARREVVSEPPPPAAIPKPAPVAVPHDTPLRRRLGHTL